VKLSEQAAKTTNPGILQIRRFRNAHEFIGDALFDITRPPQEPMAIVDPLDATRRKHFPPEAQSEDLLIPVLRRGELVSHQPHLEGIRTRAQQQLAMLNPAIKRFDNPHQYPAGLELGLHEMKTKLILQARGEL
jgi:nicotinate phosphoribosyltransferase